MSPTELCVSPVIAAVKVKRNGGCQKISSFISNIQKIMKKFRLCEDLTKLMMFENFNYEKINGFGLKNDKNVYPSKNQIM